MLSQVRFGFDSLRTQFYVVFGSSENGQGSERTGHSLRDLSNAP